MQEIDDRIAPVVIFIAGGQVNIDIAVGAIAIKIAFEGWTVHLDLLQIPLCEYLAADQQAAKKQAGSFDNRF